MYFSINKYGMRYIFKISNYEPDEQYLSGYITLECTQYLPDTGFNGFDMKNLLHIECVKHAVLNVILYAQVSNKIQIEKMIATILDIDDTDVHITFEDPVTDVIVHKVVGLPVYYFHTEGIKHLVTIERSSSENRDYLIKISTSNKDNTMLDMGSIKTGRLFRTVLLKRLNDWYKETYNKRACFKWGANVTMD
jgi:hypothetical protein